MTEKIDQMKKDGKLVMTTIIRQCIESIRGWHTEYFYKLSEVETVKAALKEYDLHIEELIDECGEVWCWAIRREFTKKKR